VIGEVVPRPRDLLLTTCRRALELPRLESVGNEPAEPVWVCVHNQDFIPLRKRLRSLGVHFLVHSMIDAESLRLLLGQLLHAGADQRGTLRLPFGCQVAYGVGLEHRKAVLADLSADGCRIISAEDVPAGTSRGSSTDNSSAPPWRPWSRRPGTRQHPSRRSYSSRRRSDDVTGGAITIAG
jgi:hypothetical protein